MMTEPRPKILFLCLSDDAGSERIVSDMGRRGAACAVLGRQNCLASLCRGLVHRFELPSRGGSWGAALVVARRLEGIAVGWRPDAVVPLDDPAAQMLRDLALSRRTSAGLRTLLRASLGDPDHYRVASSRGRLIDLAASLGVRTPTQRVVEGIAAAAIAAETIGYPVMLKREQTCGGGGVTLVENAAALPEAFRTADRRARAKHLARRMLGLDVSDDLPLTLQAHVTGSLAIRSVACRDGRVLAGSSLLAEQLDPPSTGSSTVVRRYDNAEMDEAVRRIVAALGCSGFASFDFIVAADECAYLIEMNGRPVGSGHLGPRFGNDVYGSWLGQFPGFVETVDDGARDEAARPVALFPKEMRRDPASPCLAAGAVHLHDVPWDEPRVLAEYRDRLVRQHPDHAAMIIRRLTPCHEAALPSQRAPSRRERLRGIEIRPSAGRSS